jgi:hypothetical protein
LLAITAGSFVASIVAGKLSSHAPVRWLIGPGLVLVGVGLLLMSGLDQASSWTHLLPGFLVAGVGSGFVNPPLASTAVGVVAPQRSGMASGINTTFRQIGIATGIAAYGSIFAASLHQKLRNALATIPSMSHQVAHVVGAVQQGEVNHVISAAPASSRRALAQAIGASFTSSLNILLVTSAVLALIGGVGAAILIRRKDFVIAHPQPSVQSVEDLLPVTSALNA